jgi:hypothetical protein
MYLKFMVLVLLVNFHTGRTLEKSEEDGEKREEAARFVSLSPSSNFQLAPSNVPGNWLRKRVIDRKTLVKGRSDLYRLVDLVVITPLHPSYNTIADGRTFVFGSAGTHDTMYKSER